MATLWWESLVMAHAWDFILLDRFRNSKVTVYGHEWIMIHNWSNGGISEPLSDRIQETAIGIYSYTEDFHFGDIVSPKSMDNVMLRRAPIPWTEMYMNVPLCCTHVPMLCTKMLYQCTLWNKTLYQCVVPMYQCYAPRCCTKNSSWYCLMFCFIRFIGITSWYITLVHGYNTLAQCFVT